MKKQEWTKSYAVVLCMMALCAAVSAAGADWPQLFGPNRNSISDETGLARAWPEGGPRVIWKMPLNIGWGGASVYQGKVYILDRVEDQQEVLMCLDLATGKEEWRFAYDAPGKIGNTGARSTPTVDEKYVYTVGVLGHFHCVSKATHQALWKKQLREELGGGAPEWSIAQSPLLYKNMVIVGVQGDKAGVVAFDKDTGKELWHSPALRGFPGYISPTYAKIGGVDQILMATAKQKAKTLGKGAKKGPKKGAAPSPNQAAPTPIATGVGEADPSDGLIHAVAAGIDAATGKILWTFEGWQCESPIVSPMGLSDDRVLLTGGYGAGTTMLKIARDGNKWKATPLFETQVCGSQLHPAVLYKDHFYINSNDNSRRDGLLCLDMNGNKKWNTGTAPSFERGALMLADGLLLDLDGKTGELHLIEPNPDGYRELAKAKEFETVKNWGPMALVDGKLLLRGYQEMKCLDLKKP